MDRLVFAGTLCIAIALIPMAGPLVNSAEDDGNARGQTEAATSAGSAQSAIMPLDLAVLELTDFGDVDGR